MAQQPLTPGQQPRRETPEVFSPVAKERAAIPEVSVEAAEEPIHETAPQNEVVPVEAPPIPDEKPRLDRAIDEISKRIKIPSRKAQLKKIPTVRDDITIRVEHIMEEGLRDAFLAMTPLQQQAFKIKGEEIAYKIRELFSKTHLKLKKIFRLLMEWLIMIPGVSRLYLIQEAKIKADHIVALHQLHPKKR